MLISVVQSHEHRLCLVNSGWTDSYKLRVTLVSQVRQAASLSLLMGSFGKGQMSPPTPNIGGISSFSIHGQQPKS